MFNVYFFYLLGVEFLVVGSLMLFSIRKYFPGFYKDFGCYILVATLFLALPMIFRAIDTQVYRKGKRYYNYQRNHQSFTISISVLIGSVLPVLGQLGILVFGLKKNVGK